MRRFLIIAIGLIMILSSVGFACAITANDNPPSGTTTVTVIVGDVTVTCGSNGSFTVDGKKYTGEKTFRVCRSDSFIVTFKADSDYIIDTVSYPVIGATIEGGKVTIPGGEGNVSIGATFKYVGVSEPEIISGDGEEFDGENDMTFISNDFYGNFVKVNINRMTLAPRFYTLSRSGLAWDDIIVNLKAEYLEELSPGEYDIDIVSENGVASGTFVISETSNNPGDPDSNVPPGGVNHDNNNTGKTTGDDFNIMAWLLVFVIACIGIIGVAFGRKHEI